MSDATPTKSRERFIPTLDGWRAIAVLLVILSHITHPWGESQWFQNYGGLGVRIFFGISGFLICTRMLREQEETGSFSIQRFYVRRAFRILPPLWLYLVALLFLSAIEVIQIRNRELWSTVCFFRNYLPYVDDHSDWFTIHCWSLSVEEHFYLLFPLIFFFSRPKNLVWLLPMFSALITVWRALDSRRGWVESLFGYTLEGGFRSDFMLDGLFWGCWMAILIHQFPRFFNARNMAIMGSIAFGILLQNTVGRQIYHTYVIAALFPMFFIPFVLAATTLNPNTWVGWVLDFKPLAWVGRLSYSLYLWQSLFFVMYPDTLKPELKLVQTFPGNWIALFACACFSYYLIERPFIKWGHRLANRGRVRSAELSAVQPLPGAVPAQTVAS